MKELLIFSFYIIPLFVCWYFISKRTFHPEGYDYGSDKVDDDWLIIFLSFVNILMMVILFFTWKKISKENKEKRNLFWKTKWKFKDKT